MFEGGGADSVVAAGAPGLSVSCVAEELCGGGHESSILCGINRKRRCPKGVYRKGEQQVACQHTQAVRKTSCTEKQQEDDFQTQTGAVMLTMAWTAQAADMHYLYLRSLSPPPQLSVVVLDRFNSRVFLSMNRSRFWLNSSQRIGMSIS